jgi:hypothetical protein
MCGFGIPILKDHRDLQNLVIFDSETRRFDIDDGEVGWRFMS